MIRCSTLKKRSRCLNASVSSSKYHRSATVLWDWPGGGGDSVLLPDLLDRAMAGTHVDSGVFLVRREERPVMMTMPLSSGFTSSEEVLVMSEAYRSGPGAEMAVRRLAAWAPGSGAEAKR